MAEEKDRLPENELLGQMKSLICKMDFIATNK